MRDTYSATGDSYRLHLCFRRRIRNGRRPFPLRGRLGDILVLVLLLQVISEAAGLLRIGE